MPIKSKIKKFTGYRNVFLSMPLCTLFSANNAKMAIIVSVDGTIGAGKSTLLKYLQDIPTIRTRRLIVVEENVADWVDQGLLKQYYLEPERYAFAFQLYVLHTRARRLEKAIEENPSAVIVAERTAVSDYMFATMLHTSGKMSDFEFKVYQMAYSKLRKPVVSARIILDCSPETALERCVARAREGEDTLSLDYLKQVEEYTDDYFRHDRETSCPYVCVSTEVEFDDTRDTALIFLEHIVNDIEDASFRTVFLQTSIALGVVLGLSGCVSVFWPLAF